MPGTAACVACGTALAPAAAVAVATEPPRATAWQKRVRRARKTLLGTDVPVEGHAPRAALAAAGIVPGLALWAQRRYLLAAGIVAAWAVALAAAAWFFGHALGTAALAVAIGLHYAASMLPWRSTLATLGRRDALFAALVPYALLAALYWPAQSFAGRWIVPVRFAADAPPHIARGDTLLIRRIPADAMPSPGALVALRQRPTGGGVIVDRVLGLPGDLIELSKDGWKRNGVPLGPDERPLVAGPVPTHIRLVVPPDGLFVWPSVNLRVYGNAPVDPAFGIQRRENLLGVAWRVAAPFSRRGPVEAR
ncbi:MAG: hypothetical protein IT452_05110 [Planctomycetia bacterium]|nr:hypothetical protein [Planctomycetia bacterium]